MRCRDGIRNVAAPMALGIAFIAVGVLEMGAAFFGSFPGLTNGDPAMGAVLILAGATVLNAAREFRVGRDGDAFIIVGSALGLLAGTIAIMALIATGMDACLPGGEGRANRDPLEHATLAMLMVLPAAVALRRSLRRYRSLREEVRP